MSRLIEEMKAEMMEFQRRQKEIQDFFKKQDAEFEEWKESVLSFEQFKLNFDDSLDSDNCICDGECVWSSEDEMDDQQYYEQPCEAGQQAELDR